MDKDDIAFLAWMELKFPSLMETLRRKFDEENAEEMAPDKWDIAHGQSPEYNDGDTGEPR